MLMSMVSSSSLSGPLGVIFRCSLTFLHPAFSPLVCSSTLNLNLLYAVPFTYVRYYFFVLLATPKISSACPSLTTNELVLAMGPPLLILGPQVSPSHVYAPLCHIPHLHFSNLYFHTRPIFLYPTSLH